MQPSECPVCRREYYDDSNRISIALEKKCLECVADEFRWEDEGGN